MEAPRKPAEFAIWLYQNDIVNIEFFFDEKIGEYGTPCLILTTAEGETRKERANTVDFYSKFNTSTKGSMLDVSFHHLGDVQKWIKFEQEHADKIKKYEKLKKELGF